MEILLIIILIIILLLLTASYILFFIGIVRFEPAGKSKESAPPVPAEYGEICRKGINWFKEQEKERLEISSFDGLKLVGLLLPAEGEAKGTVILFHGYRMDGYTDFSCAYQLYHNLGYNILNVFQRAHGESEGRYISFGIKERFDCCDWAMYVADRFGSEHDIFLSGLSMGSSTVLMASGTGLPENVRGIIADCGFTSPYDEFVHVLKNRFRLPVHPLVDIADMYCKAFADFGFKDYSTIEAMETNRTPVLFVHGEDDKLVPLQHTIETFRACRAEKQLIAVPKAGHGLSYLLDTQGCTKALEAFFKKYSTLK